MKTLGSRPMASVSGQYTMSGQTNLRITSGSKWVGSVVVHKIIHHPVLI